MRIVVQKHAAVLHPAMCGKWSDADPYDQIRSRGVGSEDPHQRKRVAQANTPDWNSGPRGTISTGEICSSLIGNLERGCNSSARPIQCSGKSAEP